MFKNESRCLIVGAHGFIGNPLRELLDENYVLYCTTRQEKLSKRNGWLYLDITKPETFQNLPDQVDNIVYLVKSDQGISDEERLEVDIIGLQRMLEYSKRAKRFIYLSSYEVYAPSSDILTENSPLCLGDKCSFDAATKIAAEAFVHSYSDFFDTSIFRLFFPYGAGLHGFFYDLVTHVGRKEMVFLDGNDGMLFNPIHVSDVCQVIKSSLKSEGNHLYNIAGKETISLGDFCRMAGKLMRYIPVLSEGKPHCQKIIADTQKMCKELCEPQTGLYEGMRDFLEWWVVTELHRKTPSFIAGI